MNSMLVAMLMTIAVLALPALIVLSPFIVRRLAELEKFWATCQEGQARPVTRNRKFSRFIMSFAGKCFAGELDDSLSKNNAEYWEIVEDNRPPQKESFWSGLYWIGIPPFAEIQRYKMTWIEWGFPKRNGNVSIEKEPIPHEETIGHILVQSDVYFVRVSAAETSEGVPVDVSFLLTINITNPYRALYKVQHWLEAVTNQTEGTTRVFIGTKKVAELFTIEEKTDNKTVAQFTLSPTSSEELLRALGKRLEEFKTEFGVFVELVQIQSVEPAGADAKKYRELMTMIYEAKQKAERVGIEAAAEAGKIKTIAAAQEEAANKVLGAISRIPGGQDLFHSQQVGGLENLNVYVEGDRKDKGPIIAIPSTFHKKD